MRVALVTEELAFGRGSGGIGGAFHELAISLHDAGHAVDVFYMPLPHGHDRLADLRQYYTARNIRILDVPVAEHVWDIHNYEGKSYALFRTLRALPEPYDIIHFHDYKGLGYFPTAAKQQGMAFADTALVVQLHGPTRWALEANGHCFSHEDQLKIDFMERESIARADVVVSPSRYLVDWLRQQGWRTPDAAHVHVIQNVCSDLHRTLAGLSRTSAPVTRFDEIVFFGRHEERKGIVEFCDALDIVGGELAAKGVRVTLLGGFGAIHDEPSALYLAQRSKQWEFTLGLLPDLDRLSAARYLTENARSLVVIASSVENSPYTVLEAAVLGKPLLTSSAGGAKELLDRASAAAMTCPMTGKSLAAKLRQVVSRGLRPASLAVPPAETERRWAALHQQYRPSRAPVPVMAKLAEPKVTVAITHYERPHKLHDAILSIVAQTYRNIEIVVVDDGSHSEATEACLAQLQPLLAKLQVRLIRQENSYLGAARNRAVRETESDYILFLDDDDIALPALVQTLMTAAQATRADIVQCLNLFMEEHRRGESYPFPDNFKQKVSYVPLGGPLSLAPLQNGFGSATALIRREAFDRLGGYTEAFGVGHEDYELYVRALQAGLRMEVCPAPLFLYEVGRPSMISRTSRMKNFNRVARAIETAHDSQAWSDLVSLNAGKRVVEHGENSRAYHRRTAPHAELIERIVYTASGTAGYALLLAEYGRAIGAPEFEKAMLGLARQRELPAQAEDRSFRFIRPLPQPAAPRASSFGVADENLLGAQIDLSFGRVREAVGRFCLSLERNCRLGDQHTQFMVTLAGRTGDAPELLLPVMHTLQRLSMNVGQFGQLAPALVRMALRVGDHALALAMVERLAGLEEARYLAEHPDVARAVGAGDFPSGVVHFDVSGRPEGRVGFPLLSQVGDAVFQELDIEVPLCRLQDYLTALVESRAAPAALPEAADPVAAEPGARTILGGGGTRNRPDRIGARRTPHPALRATHSAEGHARMPSSSPGDLPTGGNPQAEMRSARSEDSRAELEMTG